LSAGDAAPAWVDEASGDKRLVATARGDSLFAIRDGGTVSVALGDSVGLTDTIAGWRKQFADHQIVILGPGGFSAADPSHRTLFGLTSRAVSRVELAYADGTRAVADGSAGGFAITVDLDRRLEGLTGYDRQGQPLERLDLSHLRLRPCTDVKGYASTQESAAQWR
jgi:hypothetical protein